jgi:hypothetical protein
MTNHVPVVREREVMLVGLPLRLTLLDMKEDRLVRLPPLGVA